MVIGIDFNFFGIWFFLKVGTSILSWETIFFLIFKVFFDDLSINVAKPTSDALAFLTSLTHSRLDLPVVITSSTIKTLESLNSGSTYPDQDLLGYTLGIGTKGDLAFGNNMYYKAEATYTDFEDYSADDESSTGNKVEADLEDIAFKFSIGYKF